MNYKSDSDDPTGSESDGAQGIIELLMQRFGTVRAARAVPAGKALFVQIPLSFGADDVAAMQNVLPEQYVFKISAEHRGQQMAFELPAGADDGFRAMAIGILIAVALTRLDPKIRMVFRFPEISLNYGFTRTKAPGDTDDGLDAVAARVRELYRQVSSSDDGQGVGSWNSTVAMPPQLTSRYADVPDVIEFGSGTLAVTSVPEAAMECPILALICGGTCGRVFAKALPTSAVALFSTALERFVVLVPDEFLFPEFGALFDPSDDES